MQSNDGLPEPYLKAAGLKHQYLANQQQNQIKNGNGLLAEKEEEEEERGENKNNFDKFDLDD